MFLLSIEQRMTVKPLHACKEEGEEEGGVSTWLEVEAGWLGGGEGMCCL